MTSDTEDSISVTESSETAGETIPLPTNFETVGTVDHDDVKVYIKQSVYSRLDAFARSNKKKELGSILVGNYVSELGKTHVVISDFIEAKYTDATASTLTFTHETWDYISSERESKFPKDRIVGWQHTHPGYGVFLSSYDLFIQENFFNLPFQVAYVIDPVQGTDGFFQWKNEKIEKLQGYSIYDEVDVPVELKSVKPKDRERGGLSAGKTAGLFCFLSVLLCFILLLVMFFRIGDLGPTKNTELEAEIVSLRQAVSDQGTVIGAYTATVESLQSQIDALKEDLADSKAAEEAQDKLIGQLQEQLSGADDSGTVSFQPYTVASGDSLAAICQKNGIDYATYINIILSVNGIDDPNQIVVGQLLLLPILAK